MSFLESGCSNTEAEKEYDGGGSRTHEEEESRYVFALNRLSEGLKIDIDCYNEDVDMPWLIDLEASNGNQYLCDLIDMNIDIWGMYKSKTLDPIATLIVEKIMRIAAVDYAQ